MKKLLCCLFGHRWFDVGPEYAISVSLRCCSRCGASEVEQ